MTATEIPPAATRDRVVYEIRVELARQKVSQQVLASRIGMSQPALHRRMDGEVPFRLDEIHRIADALGVPATALLGNGSV